MIIILFQTEFLLKLWGTNLKFNKVLNYVEVSFETKRYVNNYINESIKLMQERGYIDEFIWVHDWKFDKLNLDILELIKKEIISYGAYNEHNILIPVSPDYDGVELDGIICLKYMLSDKVLLQSGFKTQNNKEGKDV